MFIDYPLNCCLLCEELGEFPPRGGVVLSKDKFLTGSSRRRYYGNLFCLQKICRLDSVHMASGVLPATGPVPKELERLKVPEVLGLDNNQLSGEWQAVLLLFSPWRVVFIFVCGDR